ncbi:MAG: hypothetical protein AAF649_07760 [Verrucomicrobiota bacterium]
MSEKPSFLFRYVLPPYACFLLLGHMVLMMVRPEYPLGDPGVPWHFKWGQVLLETMSIPGQDFFSHTMYGAEWINYQWLFQAIIGVTQWIGGIPFTTAVLMTVYAFLPVLLLQRMLREGANAIIALLLACLAWFILTMHSLDRPHVFTYLFFSILVERLYRMFEGETDLKKSWWLIPMLTLWTNLHGGFSVGLFTIGVVFLTAGCRYGCNRNAANLAIVKNLFFTGFCCGLASLINPYGIGLHLHVLSFLELKVLANWQEFASPDFYTPSGNIRGFEFLILGLCIVFFLKGKFPSRMHVLDLVLCLTFLHFALQSGRHIILFTLVATPVIARGLSGLLKSRESWFIVRRGFELTQEQLQMRGGRIYFPLIVAGYLALSLTSSAFFQDHFYDIHLSRKTAELIREQPEKFQRPFNTDNIGGALIYYFGPDIKVFADDRADFYWQEFISEKYFKVRFGLEGWDDVLAEYDVDSLILPVDNALQAALLLSPEWKKVHEDDVNVVYFKAADETDHFSQEQDFQ